MTSGEKLTNLYKADVENASKDQIFYALAMFPYPSGAGLHVGHGTNFTANDVVARFKRMNGYTVINPMGWDSFGLPTENYAMKLGKPASEVTQENIARYKRQCEKMDWSYDWDREVTTSSPEYYKRTQRIFQQLFKAGLVYKKDAFVNRCPSCQTVLANDQVIDGRCERCDTEIIQKKHPQWFIKITDYAERLITDLDTVDRPEETKTQQKYWIGKSEGAEIDFVVDTGATTKKHYIVLHGYEGSIDTNWLPRLAKNLEQAGHTVDLVELPNSATPIVAEQVQYVLDTCTFDENTIVIGHSLGCTVALKALEKISTTIEKCILVAGFLTRELMQDTSDPDYADEKKFFDHINSTFDRQYNIDIAKQHCKNFVVLHDKDDYAVQLSRAEDLARKLNTTPVIFEATQTHATGNEEPVILEYALGKTEKITVFTTRPDTLFGVTALVLAPENTSIDAYIPAENKKSLDEYRLATSKKTAIERQADAETKSGVFSGVYAIHPLTNEKVPVRFADYVLPDYATGAVMFVPAHDERDWAFAKKHGLEVKQVIVKKYIGEGDSAAREGVETLYRKTIDAIVENQNGEILVLREENPTKIHFVGGGIEEGESEIEALHKEIVEETGYTEFDVIGPIANSCINSLGYRYTKQKNQNTTGRFFHIVLKSDKQVPSEIEDGKHSIMWLPKDKVLDEVNRVHHQYAYELFLEHGKVMTEGGLLINSQQFDGLDNTEAKKAITEHLEKLGLGKKKTTYKLRDWSVSRQRYWGSPIPVYYTFADPQYNAYNPDPNRDNRIPHLIPEEELPVVLPLDLGNYKPVGKSPLADHPTFPYYHAPDGNVYLRECDTLDTFMCSSFYFIRYVDPHNEKELISKELAAKALPVDFYIGGKEHTYGHLLYSRFINKFLYDQGYLANSEPFAKLFHQGMILGPDGRKMSKRRGNVITPESLVEKYGEERGVDVLRTYTMFMGPLEIEKAWNDNAVDGVKRFLDRVERMQDFIKEGNDEKIEQKKMDNTEIQLHKAIKGVTDDIEKIKFNTAISKMMIFVNHIYDVRAITKKQFTVLLQLLAPFAVKLTQQLWTTLGNESNIHLSIRPVYDENLLTEDTFELPVQINGKMRGNITISYGTSEEDVIQRVTGDEKFALHFEGKTIKRVIFVQDKIINFILQ